MSKFKNIDFYRQMDEFLSIAKRGVHNALAENRRRRIPIVFSSMNKIYYQMPDGTITTKSPFTKKKK